MGITYYCYYYFIPRNHYSYVNLLVINEFFEMEFDYIFPLLSLTYILLNENFEYLNLFLKYRWNYLSQLSYPVWFVNLVLNLFYMLLEYSTEAKWIRKFHRYKSCVYISIRYLQLFFLMFSISKHSNSSCKILEVKVILIYLFLGNYWSDDIIFSNIITTYILINLLSWKIVIYFSYMLIIS